MKKGFTLIELLIVVLIIGILVAIALPQYEKSVEKSRMSEAVTNARAIFQANQRYYLATGQYTTDLRNLDIGIQGTSVGSAINTKYFHYYAWTDGNRVLTLVDRLPEFERYYIQLVPEEGGAIIHCNLRASPSDIQRKLCVQLEASGSL